jgi:parvulin-like peptidyl-prolyl isomerase
MDTTSKRFPTHAMMNPANDSDDADLPEDQQDEIWDDDEIDLIAERKAQQRRRYFTVLGFLFTLIIGLSVGALWMRQRYKAQKVIVSINGQIINQDDFVHRMEMASGSTTLQRMANELLQDQYAKKLGVTVTKSEVDARFKQLSSRPDFPQYLANTHQGVEDVLNQLRMELTVNKIVSREVTVTDSDVALYYKLQTDKNNPQARFYTPPRVTIAVITTRNKERIQKAKQELDHGTDFEAIAAAYSDDLTSKDHGGELPPITRGRTVYTKIPGLEKVIFGMKVGETIGPVPFGPLWSIIRCLKQEPEVTQSRDQVDYECRVGTMMSKLPKSTAARIRSDYIKFQQNANIHTFRPEYKMVFGGR